MKINLKNLMYIVFFVLLIAATYGTFTFVAYSFEYFTLLRILLMCICYFYFYKLTGHIYTKTRKKKNIESSVKFEKCGWTFVAFILWIGHLILTSVATVHLNNYLLKNDNKQTIATIKDCHKTLRGTEYCVYSYSVDNNNYEIKYCNEPDNLKLKESDTITVVYHAKFPIISKLKRELQ